MDEGVDAGVDEGGLCLCVGREVAEGDGHVPRAEDCTITHMDHLGKQKQPRERER